MDDSPRFALAVVEGRLGALRRQSSTVDKGLDVSGSSVEGCHYSSAWVHSSALLETMVPRIADHAAFETKSIQRDIPGAVFVQ
jgi:hypothetical protein